MAQECFCSRLDLVWPNDLPEEVQSGHNQIASNNYNLDIHIEIGNAIVQSCLCKTSPEAGSRGFTTFNSETKCAVVAVAGEIRIFRELGKIKRSYYYFRPKNKARKCWPRSIVHNVSCNHCSGRSETVRCLVRFRKSKSKRKSEVTRNGEFA